MICQLLPSAPAIELGRTTKDSIEQNWKRFTAWRPTKEAAALCRLLSKAGDLLYIATDVTYKEVVGLRWRQEAHPDKIPFQVVTALAIVHSRDGHLILIPRDSGDWEPALECPGGFIRAAHLTNGRLVIEDFIRKRVSDDMCLESHEIASLTYRFTYDAKGILEYMLVFDLTLSLDANELAARHPTFFVLPLTYTPQRHAAFTTKPLHPPCGNILSIAQHHAVTHSSDALPLTDTQDDDRSRS